MIVDFQHHFTPRDLFEEDWRHPDPTIHMSHLGGGIASMLGRVRAERANPTALGP